MGAEGLHTALLPEDMLLSTILLYRGSCQLCFSKKFSWLVPACGNCAQFGLVSLLSGLWVWRELIFFWEGAKDAWAHSPLSDETWPLHGQVYKSCEDAKGALLCGLDIDGEEDIGSWDPPWVSEVPMLPQLHLGHTNPFLFIPETL